MSEDSIGPLDGIRILDFTHGVAGPYATMILGDLGADVLKIERPGRGDPTRYMNVSETFESEIPNVGGDYFLAINRNKRAITIDLQVERGRDLALGLGKWADVVVQSFRPGVMERLGLGSEDFRRVKPSVIYGSMTAYGRSGPLADQPGMDLAVQARSGVMAITGLPGGDGTPVRPGVSLSDFAGGVHLAVALLAALFDRKTNGTGQVVDVSLLDATMSMLSNYSVAVMDGKANIGPMGSGHPQLAPYEAFPSTDGHLVIATGTNRLYRQLCETLGLARLIDDQRYRSNPDRVRNRASLFATIAAVTVTKPTAAWLQILEAGGVPCAPVNSMASAFDDPQLRANDMVIDVPHPRLGSLHLLGVPYKLSNHTAVIRQPPPMLGEHTDDALSSIAGLAADEIAALRADGVV